MADPAVRYRAFDFRGWRGDARVRAPVRVERAVPSAGEAVCGQVCRKQGLVHGGWLPDRVRELRPAAPALSASLTRTADRGALT